MVNTVYDLANLKELESQIRPFSTFFHEYLHYLQDITTSFGLMNGLEIQNRLKFYNSHAKNHAGGYKIPISKGLRFDIGNSHDMNQVYLGHIQSGPIPKIVYVERVKSEVFVPTPYNTDLEKIVVGMENSMGKIEEMDFGGYSIVESMAFIGQKQCCGEVQLPEAPYELAQKVAMHIYPEFAHDNLNVFALCDVSLMTYHPGYCFFEFLKGIQQDKIVPKRPEEVYDLFYARMTGNGKGMLEHFNQLVDEAKLRLVEYFTDEEQFKTEKVWLETVLDRARRLRIGQPYFMLELIRQQAVNSNYLYGLILELGSPLIQNDIGESHSFLASGFEEVPVRIEMFAYIGEIFEVFERGKTTCGLKKFCKQSVRGDITDSRCDERPWERSKDIEVCGFGLFWRMWGLENCQPETKDL